MRKPAMDDKPESVVQLHPDSHVAMLEAAERDVPPEPQDEPSPVPATTPAALPATIEPANGDASFPSPHVIYLGVVKNELDAQLMRFRNGLQMLTAKIKGAEAIYQDATKALVEESKRKQQDLDDARLSEVTRLRVQIGDVQDVIETYEAAIEQATSIVERQAKTEEDAAAAVKDALDKDKQE